MTTKEAVSNLGEEELAQARRKIMTRAETRAEADEMFGDTAKQMRVSEQGMMQRLFEQWAARDTMQPSLVKTSSVKNISQFFEKLGTAHLTEAQRRYPELLKVAGPSSKGASTPVPDLKQPKPEAPNGKTPSQPLLSRA